MNSAILAQIKKFNFKPKTVLSYTELNNKSNTTTPTDINNEIHKVLKGSNVNEKLKLLEAILDDQKDYTVVINKNSKSGFQLLDIKNKETADLIIKDDNKGTVSFSSSNSKIKIEFYIKTPEIMKTITKDKTEEEKLAELGIKLTSKFNDGKLKNIIEVLENMSKTK